MIEVDVVVIGADTAGLNAVAEVRKSGRSWVLVESGPYGTTCARVGSMPSKLLIAAADRAHQVATAGVFGISTGPMSVDTRAMFGRLCAERDRFVEGAVKSTTKLPEDQRLSRPTTVLVECGGHEDIELSNRRRLEIERPHYQHRCMSRQQLLIEIGDQHETV